MDKRMWKSFMIREKIDVLAKVDVHTGTYGDLVLQWGLWGSTLNTVVKNV
jgi:hypothetical protein